MSELKLRPPKEQSKMASVPCLCQKGPMSTPADAEPSRCGLPRLDVVHGRVLHRQRLNIRASLHQR
jgi:hypothetical protein